MRPNRGGYKETGKSQPAAATVKDPSKLDTGELRKQVWWIVGNIATKVGDSPV